MAAAAQAYKIGVDIGGTFTDVTIIETGGRVTSHKTPSTPRAPAEAVLRGLREAIERARLDPGRCMSFVHGSTIGVNTIIQRTGARVGVRQVALERQALGGGKGAGAVRQQHAGDELAFDGTTETAALEAVDRPRLRPDLDVAQPATSASTVTAVGFHTPHPHPDPCAGLRMRAPMCRPPSGLSIALYVNLY